MSGTDQRYTLDIHDADDYGVRWNRRLVSFEDARSETLAAVRQMQAKDARTLGARDAEDRWRDVRRDVERAGEGERRYRWRNDQVYPRVEFEVEQD